MAEPAYYYSNISNGYSIHSDGEVISSTRNTVIYHPVLTSTMAQYYNQFFAPAFPKLPKPKLTLKDLLCEEED